MVVIFAQPQYDRTRSGGSSTKSTKFEVRVEKWRCLFYAFFLSMVAFAVLISKIWTEPMLEAGAPEGTPTERRGCGPFNRGNSTFGFGYGDGFKIDESHLTEAFGYNNICSNWDYTPAREIISMYFPLMEYSMVIYLLFNYVTDMLTYNRGSLPAWYWNIGKILSPLAIFFTIQFRQIFVIIAYENIEGHTAAFLGFQITLVIIAIMNTLYVLLSGQSYPSIKMNQAVTAIVVKIYIVCNMAVSAVKLYATAYAVATGTVPALLLTDVVPGLAYSKLIDNFWLLFNVLLPLIISFIRMRNEEPLVIEVSMPKHSYEEITAGEQARML